MKTHFLKIMMVKYLCSLRNTYLENLFDLLSLLTKSPPLKIG